MLAERLRTGILESEREGQQTTQSSIYRSALPAEPLSPSSLKKGRRQQESPMKTTNGCDATRSRRPLFAYDLRLSSGNHFPLKSGPVKLPKTGIKKRRRINFLQPVLGNRYLEADLRPGRAPTLRSEQTGTGNFHTQIKQPPKRLPKFC